MTRYPALALLAMAAGTAGAQQLPPIRPLGPVVAKSEGTWINVANIRSLPGARVLVNDLGGRKVVLLDSALVPLTVVADTTAATATAYSGRVGGLIPYRADSTLFVDPQSLSMMVIDGSGKIARVMSVPRSEDAAALVGFLGAGTAFDGQDHLIYRSPFRFTRSGPPRMTSSGLPEMPTIPDSAAVVRVDLTTRQLDTVGFIRIPKINMQVTQDDKGNVRMQSEVNPLPLVDEWAVLPNGTVALVRGRDYHVDFVNPDGGKTSAPKVPFEWQRLTDEDKVAFIDSVKAARARLAASSPDGATRTTQLAGAAGAAGGSPQVVVQMNRAGPGAARGGAGDGAAPRPELAFVSPSELPDYKPPFFAGAVRADGEGNLWVRTIPTRQIPGGPVYDVINSKGELVDRVQLPVGRTIIGFGPDGSVYLTSRDGTTQALERARVK